MRGLLIGIVILMFLAGLMVLAVSLFSTISVGTRLSNTTDLMAQDNSLPNIALNRVHYYNTTVSRCDENLTTDIVIADVLYDGSDIPEKCEILVDSRFEKHVELPDVPCDNCTSLKLSIDIRKQDVRIVHTIELCCDNACTRRKLASLC